MWVRTAVVLTLAVVLMLGQTLMRYSFGPRTSATDSTSGLVSTIFPQRASAQNDDNDNSGDSCDDSGDDDDDDNGNSNGNDNSADDGCDSSDGDNGDSGDGDNGDGDNG